MCCILIGQDFALENLVHSQGTTNFHSLSGKNLNPWSKGLEASILPSVPLCPCVTYAEVPGYDTIILKIVFQNNCVNALKITNFSELNNLLK